jgi:transposase
LIRGINSPRTGGLNTKLHAVTDARGRPIRFFMTAAQVRDCMDAAALLRSLPGAEWLIADRGYGADWFRDALNDKGIKPVQGGFDAPDQILPPFTPGRKSHGKAIRCDRRRYKRRNRIEIMFGRLKDWPSASGSNRWRLDGSTSRPATTDAPRPSSSPSPAPLPSCSGFDDQ